MGAIEGPRALVVRAGAGCPTCGAGPGQRCRGRKSGNHGTRNAAYRAIDVPARRGLWVIQLTGSRSTTGHYAPEGTAAPKCGTVPRSGSTWRTPPQEVRVEALCPRCCQLLGVVPPSPVPWDRGPAPSRRQLTKARAISDQPGGLQVIQAGSTSAGPIGHFAAVPGGVELCRSGIRARVPVTRAGQIRGLCRNCVRLAAEQGYLDGWDPGHGVVPRLPPTATRTPNRRGAGAGRGPRRGPVARRAMTASERDRMVGDASATAGQARWETDTRDRK